jgi:hypothetical protein
MVQSSQDLRLALETRHALLVSRKCFGQNFCGDTALEPRIRCAIHLTHAAGAEFFQDLIVGDCGSN